MTVKMFCKEDYIVQYLHLLFLPFSKHWQEYFFNNSHPQKFTALASALITSQNYALLPFPSHFKSVLSLCTRLHLHCFGAVNFGLPFSQLQTTSTLLLHNALGIPAAFFISQIQPVLKLLDYSSVTSNMEHFFILFFETNL